MKSSNTVHRETACIVQTPKSKGSKRRDPRQMKPQFSEFVEKWGLRGRRAKAKGMEGVEEQQRAVSGVYLHPWLSNSIGWLQQSFMLGYFPYRSRAHTFAGSQQIANGSDLGTQGRAAQRKARRNVPLSQVEPELISHWHQHHKMLRRNWRRLSEAMLAAAACGDVEFFKHIALIVQATKETEERLASGAVANPERMAVWVAIQDVRGAWFEKNVPEGQLCDSNDCILDWGAINDEMLSNERASVLAPKWGKKDIGARQKFIERVAKAFGYTLTNKRPKQ